jgi:hypothetical protein
MCRASSSSKTMQVVLQSIMHPSQAQKQTPRAAKLQAMKGLHQDAVPLLLDAEAEIGTLELLPQIKQLMMLQARPGMLCRV